METISVLKFIAETITAISTAFVVIFHLCKVIPQPVKNFFGKTMPLFFNGTIKSDGKKVRFFKALRINTEQQKQQKNIIQTLTSNLKTEEILVLNKTELFRFLSDSNIFTKVTCRN